MVCLFHLGKLEKEFPLLADSATVLRHSLDTKVCDAPVRCVAELTLHLTLLNLHTNSERQNASEHVPVGFLARNGEGEGDKVEMTPLGALWYRARIPP